MTAGVSSVVKNDGHLFIEKKKKLILIINVFDVFYAYDRGGGREVNFYGESGYVKNNRKTERRELVGVPRTLK